MFGHELGAGAGLVSDLAPSPSRHSCEGGLPALVQVKGGLGPEEPGLMRRLEHVEDVRLTEEGPHVADDDHAVLGDLIPEAGQAVGLVDAPANGRGLGIAARYFFDKEVAELDPLESAFLAGMVKGPANYDPFIARSTERREAALTRAHQRTAYVVDRMLVAGMLDERGRVIGAIDEAEHVWPTGSAPQSMAGTNAA